MHPVGALFTALLFLLAAGLFVYALWQPTSGALSYAGATYYAVMSVAAFAAAGIVAYLSVRFGD